MTKLHQIALAALALTFASCASAPVAQTFQAPSLAPAQQAVARVEQHVSGAQGVAKKLADECAKKNAGWQSAYDQLMQELTNAQLAAQAAQDELKNKQTEIVSVVDSANKNIAAVAKDRDAARAEIAPLKASRHGWVKRFWMASGVVVLLGAWVTKGLWLKLLPLVGL